MEISCAAAAGSVGKIWTPCGVDAGRLADRPVIRVSVRGRADRQDAKAGNLAGPPYGDHYRRRSDGI